MNLPLLNGLGVAILAVVLVIARVLWPKEIFQRRREERLNETSVREMREGLQRLNDEDYSAALILFKEAIKQTPKNPAPYLLRIYTLGMLGRRVEARLELHQMVNRWKVQTLPGRLLALAYLGAGNYDQAYVTADKALKETPSNPLAFVTKGDICRLTERYGEAETTYNAAIGLNAPRPSAGLAFVLACQGKIQQAEHELSFLPEKKRYHFESLLALAQIHAQSLRLNDALRVYEVLLQDHPEVPRVLVPYALLLLQSGDYRQARLILEPLALQQNADALDDDPFVQCAYAQILLEAFRQHVPGAQDNLAQAQVHLRRALHLWQGYGKARSVFGDLLVLTGKKDAAIEQYTRAIELNSFLPDAHLHLAALLRERGDADEAREHERIAQRQRPSARIPATEEVIVVTTDMLHTVALPAAVAPSAGGRFAESASSPRKSLVEEVRAITGKNLPPLTRQPSTPPPMPPKSGEISRPVMTSDIMVLPGSRLLFDQSTDGAFTQTLQSQNPPQDVRAFYWGQMQHDGWQMLGERRSIIADLEGVTGEWQRTGQHALITIGLLLPHRRTSTENGTYVVTYVTHRFKPDGNG